MKKTLFALLALGSLAMGKDITLPATTDYTWISARNAVVEEVNADGVVEEVNAEGLSYGVNADIVKIWATAIDSDTGWFAGTGQNHDANSSYAGEVDITSSSSFEFVSRPALSGTYVAMGVELTEAAESITLSFDYDKKVAYSLWAWDGTTAKALAPLTSLTTAGTETITYNTAEVAADTTIYAIWESKYDSWEGGGTVITVDNIALSYVAAPVTPGDNVPEPTTATLSLLALAGLAARRRRK